MVKRVLQRKDANMQAWMAQRDGAEWCLARTAICHASVGYRGGFETTLLTLIEWQQDLCRCPPSGHREGCDRPRERLAEYRSQRPGRAIQRLCESCERPADAILESEQCRRCPGAVHPLDGCYGCTFSHFGELELDKSLLAAGLGGRR